MRRFNTYIAVFSLVIDSVAIFIGLILAYRLRSGGEDIFAWPFYAYLKLAAIMLPLWLVFFASQGVYNVQNAPRGWSAAAKLLIGLLSGWAVMIIAFYFWRSTASESFPRLIIIYGVVLTAILVMLGRFVLTLIVHLLYRLKLGTIKTIAIIDGNSKTFIERLEKERRYGRQLLATIDSSQLGELKDWRRKGMTEIIVASSTLPEAQLLELLDWAEKKNLNFIVVPSLLSVRTTNVETGVLAGTPVMFFRRTPLEGWGRVFKRILDLILVIPAIILLSPIYLLLAVLVKITSPGPIFYSHARVGQDGKIFKICKFRSMYNNAEREHNVSWSMDEAIDPRITPFGRVIRRTNLDEIPQLWDVFTGKMSIVGPRPEQPRYVEQFAKETPNYLKRHHVKSGLTGWAQINGARGNTPIADRVKYDLYYIENWSIWFDIRIILATIIYMFRQLNSDKERETTN